MEHNIGEIFEYNGEWYQCVELKGCIGCAFYNSACDSIRNVIGTCTSGCRSDTTSVIFKKLEKVGEPHFIKDEIFDGGKIYVQNFKVYEDFEGHKPICNDYIVYDWKNRIISIEIKQKEDMEERELNSHMTKVIDEATQKLEEEICSQIRENINKQRMKPFDLEAAKAGKPVCTRDGRKARIICFDRKDVRPIIALIKSDNYDDEGVYYYYADGLNLNSYPSAFDLMMLPEKREGWVNIYDDMRIYASEEGAKTGISTERNYITTTKVEWEE